MAPKKKVMEPVDRFGQVVEVKPDTVTFHLYKFPINFKLPRHLFPESIQPGDGIAITYTNNAHPLFGAVKKIRYVYNMP